MPFSRTAPWSGLDPQQRTAAVDSTGHRGRRGELLNPRRGQVLPLRERRRRPEKSNYDG